MQPRTAVAARRSPAVLDGKGLTWDYEPLEEFLLGFLVH